MDKTGVLFVCLGNICRSPIAEGVFLHLARERGVLDRFEVDSCGTGSWHVGERADSRARMSAERRGIELVSVARQVDPERDFDRFTWIVAMDRSNVQSLLRVGAPKDRVHLMRSFDAAAEKDLDVPDPYFGGDDGFETVLDMVEAACAGLLDRLAAQ